MKPEKFQAKQEDMMASVRKRGLYSLISFARFSQDLIVEKWIQFHASHIRTVVFRGTGRIRFSNK